MMTQDHEPVLEPHPPFLPPLTTSLPDTHTPALGQAQKHQADTETTAMQSVTTVLKKHSLLLRVSSKSTEGQQPSRSFSASQGFFQVTDTLLEVSLPLSMPPINNTAKFLMTKESTCMLNLYLENGAPTVSPLYLQRWHLRQRWRHMLSAVSWFPETRSSGFSCTGERERVQLLSRDRPMSGNSLFKPEGHILVGPTA